MFVVPESDATKPENRFEFQVGDKKFSVPKLGFAPGPASLLFEQGRDIEGSLACFDDDAARTAYLSLDVKQRDAIDTAWVAASKVSPGESQGSASS